MKFLYLKTKTATLMAMLSLGMVPGSIYAFKAPSYDSLYDNVKNSIPKDGTSSANYTDSIESIYKHFDGIMDNFEQIFKNSFSDKSSEKLNITAQKLKDSETVIKQFVAALKKKTQELKNAGKQSTDLYRFIDILLHLADEIEVYFTKAYNALASSLNKKLKATALAKQLSDVIDVIMTDANFKKLNDYLTHLQGIAPKKVVQGIDDIHTDINKILAEYKKNKARQNAAAISMLRKRLPY